MTIIRYGALALMALAGCLAFAPAAQARLAPSGSYQATCRNVRFDGESLTASCKRRDGSWHNSYLDNADDCDASIVNNDGQLECGFSGWHRDGRGERDYDAPRGSYRDSCYDIRMNGSTLEAACQRRNDRWIKAWLKHAYDCDGRIDNDDGRLICGSGRRR